MMLPRMQLSPVPIQTMSGADSETATAPTDALVIWPSVTGVQFSPESVVFQRPPPVAPKYPSFGRPRTPLMAIDRPPRSGPIERQWYRFRIVVSRAGALATTTGFSAVKTQPENDSRPAARRGSFLIGIGMRTMRNKGG